MGEMFAFNASAMRGSAAQTRTALAGVTTSGYTRVDNCGSAIVVETVDFFLDLLEEALSDAETAAEKLAANIELTADDFVATEAGMEAEVDTLVVALKELY